MWCDNVPRSWPIAQHRAYYIEVGPPHQCEFGAPALSGDAGHMRVNSPPF